MNRLRGIITAISCNDHLSLVDIMSGEDSYTAIVLETPQSAAHLKVGNEVAVLFKETEVSLARNLAGDLSLRNRVPGRVRQIREGGILSEVVLECKGGMITSVITTRAVRRFGLQLGEEVEALVKANEVTLMEADDAL